MKNYYIFCSMDRETGKYTGAACAADSPNLQKWRDMEYCAGSIIKKMDALSFAAALEEQGIDLDKYADVLEGKP